MPTIKTDGLTKEFGAVTAVMDLNLTVEEGEIFGFLGPNGAGKSTTLNLLLGFVAPTAGTGEVLGHDIEQESRPLRKQLGILPEGGSPYAKLTGREHLDSAIRMMDADESPATILEEVGLDEDAWDRLAGTYSTGMQQRLMLAIALVGDPDLLILDEPTTGLDPTGVQELRAVIQDQTESGTTVFFSSHLLSEVEAICDRVGIMNDGRLIAVDTLDALQNQARSASQLRIDAEAPISAETQQELYEYTGVDRVELEGTTIHVVCSDPQVKMAVLTHIDQYTNIVDLITKEPSLETIFESYITTNE